MCDKCGCRNANHEHFEEEKTTHSHYHKHDNGVYHSHEHKHHDHEHEKMIAEENVSHGHIHIQEAIAGQDKRKSKIIEIERKVLEKNDELADRNRQWLAERGIISFNIISSPGSGKTLLLEKTLSALNGKISCAVIVGDQQTDNDARRLQGKGAKIRQIETYSSCHLNADQIFKVLPEVADNKTKILFIENVGNLICPAAFDLGENIKIALLSVTEGEDKPLKYPVLFSEAEIVIITKIDLVPYLDCELDNYRENIRLINPKARIIELSAKTGDGMAEWLEYLKILRENSNG